MLEEERKYDALDELFRDALLDGEEKVPSRVWRGVSGRIGGRHRGAAVWGWALAGTAAAAVAAFLFLPSGPQGTAPGLPLVADAVSVVPSPVEYEEPDWNMTRTPVAARETAATAVREQADAAEAAEDAAVTIVGNGAGENTVTEKPAGNSSSDRAEQSRRQGSAPDPLDLLAYEDSKKADIRRHASLVAGGVVCTNDNIAAGVRNTRLMASSGSGSAKSGISQSGPDVFGIPISFQAGVRVDLTANMSIGAGISYTLLTRSFTGNLLENGVTTVTGLDVLHSAGYVGIPVNLYFDLWNGPGFHLYSFAGGAAEKCVSSHYEMKGNAYSGSLDEKAEGLQWSAGLGLGVQYDITDHLGFFLDPSARYYFDCGQPTTIRTRKPLMFDFSVGLRFSI